MTLTNKEVRDALNGSIQKWHTLALGVVEEKGTQDCALCSIFFNSRKCIGCPVKEHTGYPGCKKTPYDKWDKMVGIYRRIANSPELKEVAVEMRDFLIFLDRKYFEEGK